MTWSTVAVAVEGLAEGSGMSANENGGREGDTYTIL